MKLCRSAQKALIYNTSSKFKNISINYLEKNVVDVQFIVSEQLTEEEYGLISKFEAKMKCYIPELEKVNIKILDFNENISHLDICVLAFDDLLENGVLKKDKSRID